MELTKKQRKFFAGLDLDKAIKAGEGKLRFQFTHKDHDVFVEVCSMSDADITVLRKVPEGGVLIADRELSLYDIPNSQNVSGPTLLRQLYKAVYPPVDPALNDAWLNTPYVSSWEVKPRPAYTKFRYLDGDDRYTISAAKDPDNAESTAVELRVNGETIHTFNFPMPYQSRPTVQDLLALADIITQAWRDAVCGETQ